VTNHGFQTSLLSKCWPSQNKKFVKRPPRLAFDFSFVAETLNTAGFAEVQKMAPRVSLLFPEHVLAELEPLQGYIESSLVVEARKIGEC